MVATAAIHDSTVDNRDEYTWVNTMARTANTRTAVAVWPEGQDQPWADFSQMFLGGRSRCTTCFASATALASPAQAATASTTASQTSRPRTARTTMSTAVVTRATHDPSHVIAFIAVLSAGVRCATTN